MLLLQPTTVRWGAVGQIFFIDAWWWYYDAWIWQDGWRRIYSRGPMWLTQNEANVEWGDTQDAFFEGLARRFQWSGSNWIQS